MRIIAKLIINLFLFFILTACLLENQRPENNFVEKRLPKMLEKMANDEWQLKRKLPMIDRLIKRNQAKPRFLIGIIDNGNDMLHPEMIRNINWQRNEKGELVSGFDPAGGTRLANASFINPKPFAFGAEKIVAGRIKGAPENPLDLMKSINDTFHKLLMQELAFSSHDFTQTHFSKIDSLNFTIFDAIDLFFGSGPENLEKYRERKKDGKLLPFKFVNRAYPRKLIEKNIILDLDTLYLEKWDARKGEKPLSLSEFWWLEGAEEFYKVLKSVLAKVDTETDLYRHLQNYHLFIKHQKSSPKERRKFIENYELKSTPGSLHSNLNFKLMGPRFVHPFRSFITILENNVIRKKVYSGKTVTFPMKVTTEEVIELLEVSMEITTEALLKDHQNPTGLLEKTKAEKVKMKLKEMQAVYKYLIENRKLSLDGVLSDLDKKMEAKITREMIFYQHPFYSSKSTSKSHGTHVASAALNGNRNDALIESVRPLTESMDISYEQYQEIQKNFEENFKGFLENPVIYRGLKDLLAQYDLDISGMKKDKVVSTVLDLTRVHAHERAKDSALDFLFVNQIIDSIKHVGEKGILVSNVSLGYEFNKPADTADKTDPMRKLFDFLAFEYFKFQVSKTIVEFAPHSLFMVAAGNSGAWIDGLSKSALPFDLTSTYFRRYETKTQKLPNHIQNNVVGVVSSGDFRMLSSFTNLPIHNNVPIVVSHGEDVLSAVRTMDQSYNATVANEYLNTDVDTYLWYEEFNEEEAKEIFEKYLGKEGYAEFERKLSELSPMNKEMFKSRMFTQITTNVMMIESTFRSDLKKRYPMQRSRYNGTSMATPNALQVLARSLIAKAKSLGMPLNDLYGKPGFTTAEIISDLKSLTEPLSKDVYLIPLNKIKGTKDYRPDEVEKELRKILNEVTGKGSLKRDAKASPGTFKKSPDHHELRDLKKRKDLFLTLSEQVKVEDIKGVLDEVESSISCRTTAK
ncbi:MAG: S8 family serine peptidase [Bdellovibrionota bacterium]|nr:S8 family serine peptidase [Bdellovibrionota bacterium]